MNTRQNIDVETGALLIIDPTHLPPELVANLIGHDDENNPKGIIVPLDTDGTYTVNLITPAGPIIID